MNCPNINIKEVRNEFNSVIEAFGGRPMTIEEFKSRDIRNQRTGADNKAMQLAYYVWDKTNGNGIASLPEYIDSNINNEYARIRAIVNEMIGVRPSPIGMTRSVKSEILRINSMLQNRVRGDYFGYSTIDDSSLDFNARMVYDPRSGQVMLQINLANANIGSVFHEYSHPILLSIRNSNSDRFFEVFEDLHSSEEFSELRNKAIDRIESIYGNDFLLSEEPLDGRLEEEIIATAVGIYFEERNKRTFSQKFKDFIVKLYKLFLDFFGIKSDAARNISADEIKSFSDLLEFLGDSNAEIPIPQKDVVDAYEPEPDQLADEYVSDFVDNDIKQLVPLEGVSDLIGTQLAHKVPLLPQKPKNDIITEDDAKLKIAIDITSKLKNLIDAETNNTYRYISRSSGLVVDIEEKGWYNKLLDNFFGDNKAIKKVLKSPLGPYIPKAPIKSIYSNESIRGKLLSGDPRNNVNSRLDTSIGGDMASDIEVTSKLLKYLESNPNGSTDYDFDFSKISGISEIELEVVNEFMSEFIEKSKAWAIENNKPEPTKVKNSRLAKRLSEHLGENYKFRLLPVEEQSFTYGIQNAVSRDYFKSDIGGSEILISNGLIVNNGHTYTLRSGESEVNALGWFIEYSVNDKYLLYEFQSDFADGDWDVNISQEAKLSFNNIISGLLSGKHIDNTDNFDGEFSREYLKYVDKSAKFLLSVIRDYSRFANGRFDSIFNGLSLKRHSIHNLIYSLDFVNKLIELGDRELGKIRKYGMNLKRYSKKQLNLISSIAEKHINSIGTKTGKRTGRRTISESDAAFNARKEIVSMFYDNYEFNNIGISVSLADFKNRVDRAIAIHDSAERNFGDMHFAGKRLPVEEVKKAVQYRISRWDSIYGGEGVTYELVRDGSKNEQITYMDGSKKISVDVDIASVKIIKPDVSRYRSAVVSYAYLQNEIGVNEYYYDLISWKITDYIMDAPYSSDYINVAAGREHLFMDRLKRDMLSMHNKWFYKSLYMSIVHAKKSGKSTVYLPTSEFMSRIGDASGPYVTKFESKETSKPIGGIYTALDKISGISYEQKTIPEFKFPVVEVDITNFGAGPIERFEKSDKSANIPEESQSVQSLFDRNIDILRKSAATANKENGLDKYISVSKFNSLKKRYNDNPNSRIEVTQMAKIKNVMPDGHDGIDAKAIIKKSAYAEARKSAIAERERQLSAGYVPQNDSMTSEEKLSIASQEVDVVQVKKDTAVSDLEARGGTQTNMLDQLFNSQSKVVKKASKRALKIVTRIAESMSNRFGVGFVIVDRAEATKIYEDSGAKFIKDDDGLISTSYRGFYNNDTNVAYIIKESIDGATAVHEIFGHPFLNALKSSEKTAAIYNQLAVEAAAHPDIVASVVADYTDTDDAEITDEIIIRVIESYASRQLRKTKLGAAIERYLKEFTSIIKNILGIKSTISTINPKSTIEQIAEWAIYGEEEMSLVFGDDAADVERFAEDVIGKFSSRDISELNAGIISLDQILSTADSNSGGLVYMYLEANGIRGRKTAIDSIKSELNNVVFNNGSGFVYSPSGELLGQFTYSVSGNNLILESFSTGSKISIGTFIASIAKGLTKTSQGKLLIENNRDIDSYGIMEEVGLIPMSAIHAVNFNGKTYTAIDNDMAKIERVIMRDSKVPVSSSVASAHLPSEFITIVTDGLKAQISSLERSRTSDPTEIDKLNMLIDSLQSSTRVQAAQMFVKHAIIESRKVLKSISDMKALVAMDQDVPIADIISVQKDFLTLYERALDSISVINEDPYSILNVLPKSERDAINTSINELAGLLKSVKDNLAVVFNYKYMNQLKENGDAVGSTTIDERLSRNIFIEEKDISMLSSVLFGMAFSEKEQMRSLHKMVIDVKSKVNKEFETDGVLAGLVSKWEKIKKSNPFATYKDFFEYDSDGKATGYLVSDLLRGSFAANLNAFRKSLQKKYKLSSPFDVPEDPKQRMEFDLEMDTWLDKHAERRFTSEYYRLRHSLTLKTREALDIATGALNQYIAPFIQDGFLDTSLMTEKEYETYKKLKKEKQNLSSERYADGKEKSGEALRIARELTAFNKAMADNIKYKPNEEAYNKAEARIAEKYGYDSLEFLRWWSENNKEEYTQEFWDEIAALDRAEQTDEWNIVYKARAAILRIHREVDSMDVNAAKLAIAGAEAQVKEFDIWLSQNRRRMTQMSRFSEIAEIVPTDEWKERRAEAEANPNPLAISDFLDQTTFIGYKGKIELHSQWSKIVPKDKRHIRVVRSSIWSEVDESSSFYNNNFNESEAEGGLVPKRSMYDNSEKFNKVMANDDYFDFYNEVLNAYKKANSLYFHLKNPSPYRLAQIAGSALHKLTHSDSLLKGFMNVIRDKFSYRSYEAGFGDSDLVGKFRADGSPVMNVDVRYRTMLDNPNHISRDLLGSLALYYKSALNFKYMTEKRDEIELVLEGIKSTKIVTPRSKVGDWFASSILSKRSSDQGTLMYKRSKEFVETNVYGHDIGNTYSIKLPVPKFLLDPDDDSKRVISLAKPIKDFINYVRKLNLVGNVRAIFSNMVTAGLQLKIEAAAGSYFDSKTLSSARNEVLLSMPNIIRTSTVGRGNNKVISLMRLFDVTRSNEADMSGLHGSKLLNTIKNNIWYGPYTAGDFIVKSQMTVALLMSYKYYNGEFISREAFMSKYFPGKRYDGDIVFNAIPENLYDALIVGDNVVGVKEEYSDAVNDNLLANISSLLGNLGRKLDGTLTGSEKSRLHADAFGAALLLHRGWLVNALQERFHPKMFSYEKQMYISGQYAAENFSSSYKILKGFIGNKIGDILSGKNDAWKLTKLGTMKDEFDSSQLYNSRRILGELLTLAILAVISGLLYNMVPKNPEEPEKGKDYDSWEAWAYIMALRVSLEMFALYSPMDVYNIVGSPTAAEQSMENIRGVFTAIGDGSFNEYVESGKYKYKPKWMRSAIKLTPGVKQIYENVLKADLKASERFMLSNIPTGPLGLTRVIFDSRTDEERARDEMEKEMKDRRMEISKFEDQMEKDFKKSTRKKNKKSRKDENLEE